MCQAFRLKKSSRERRPAGLVLLFDYLSFHLMSNVFSASSGCFDWKFAARTEASVMFFPVKTLVPAGQLVERSM